MTNKHQREAPAHYCIGQIKAITENDPLINDTPEEKLEKIQDALEEYDEVKNR